MLRSKIENKASGILLYGLTPPKAGHSEEKLREISARHIERIKDLAIDGVVLYDIQDESCRNSAPRPFPFIETLHPLKYSSSYLKDLEFPKIIYSGIGRFNSATFENWLEAHNSDLDFLVLVGTPSRRSDQNLALHDAYQIRQQKIVSHILGGVTIPERHVRKQDEHFRVVSKTVAGCAFFISQCVYNVENAKNFLNDYCSYLKNQGEEPVPIIFTVTPCGSQKTLQFMEWLGIEVPVYLREELESSTDMLTRSVEVCQGIIDELIEHANGLCVPIGFNVESVAIRKDEINASIALVQYIAKKWNRISS